MSQITTSVEATEAAAADLIKTIQAPSVIYLRGALGAGKTTFVRGALQAMGYTGLVKSPTFTLAESYAIRAIEVHHFDLYRISDPEELDYIGIREYCHAAAMCFIEWPDLGLNYIPEADVEVNIEYSRRGRQITITQNTS